MLRQAGAQWARGRVARHVPHQLLRRVVTALAWHPHFKVEQHVLRASRSGRQNVKGFFKLRKKEKHQIDEMPPTIPEVFLFNQLLHANISATSQLQFPDGGKSSSDLRYLGALLYRLNEPRCGRGDTWAWPAALGGFAPASDPPDATVAWTQCTARTRPGGPAGSTPATQITKGRTIVCQSSIGFKWDYSPVGNITCSWPFRLQRTIQF